MHKYHNTVCLYINIIFKHFLLEISVRHDIFGADINLNMTYLLNNVEQI